MTHSASALKAQYDLHTRLFNNALDGVDENDALTRSSDHVNHIKWVAGHLLNTRLDSMARMTGGAGDSTYGQQFGRGMALDPTAAYPPIDEITTKWNEVSGSISERLTTLPEDLLDSPSPGKAPIADETFRGMLAFLISHEAYHIGQLSILRKLLGKEAMSYK